MSGPRGVNVVGPLTAESGVGEASRAVVAALDAAGVDVLPLGLPEDSPSRQGAVLATAPLGRLLFPVTLLCATAFETAPLLAALPAGFTAGRRTVGLWWWEVEEFPAFMAEGFQHLDAVWTGSDHVRRAIAAASDGTPVQGVRYPVRRPRPSAAASREALGLPTGGPLFLTVFGYYSSVVRKNPAGVIEAFRRAFPPGSGPQLVLKAIDHEAHPAEHAELSALVDRHPDVHFLPGYLDRQGMDDLLAAADVVVSLHRAEGFGYTPAEAMALGKPVIATGYSGNLEYMDAGNARLVDFTLVPIGEHGGPYPPTARWADPDLDDAAQAMRDLAGDHVAAQRLGDQAARDMADRFTAAAAGRTMVAALEALPAGPGADGRAGTGGRGGGLAAWRTARLARKLAATRSGGA